MKKKPIMKKNVIRAVNLCFLILSYCAVSIVSVGAEKPLKPNIVFILADDLGYGDLKCINPESKISTPNLDRLAKEGMVFTDAHSTSAVCSPTRYSILTGRYNWRSRLQSGVLGGLSPRLIEQGRLTLPMMLKKQGYHTACIGKWHLGMNWALAGEKKVNELSIETPEQHRNVDFSKRIKDGPNAVGFDYYFGISASLDMVPYTFIENDRVTELPTIEMDFPMMHGKDKPRTRKGPGAPGFEASNVLPVLTQKAVDYIKSRRTDALKGKPFFLYLAYASPHTPIAPTQEWLGKSGLNPYGDFVMETDWSVGEVLKALDELNLATNTLVIFTSDNGCAPLADIKYLLSKGHNPSYNLRGYKADIFEGGHRIPLIVRWHNVIKAGSRSSELVCQMDFMATFAEMLGIKLPDNAAEDSVSILPVLLGKNTAPVREALVHHSVNGSFAIRHGKWKLIFCPDSGGWSDPRPNSAAAKKLPQFQLYDLENDIAETTNLVDKHPQIVKQLSELLEKYIANGRSTPGKPQKNAFPIKIRKGAG